MTRHAITSGQVKQIKRIVEDAAQSANKEIEGLGLDPEVSQHIQSVIDDAAKTASKQLEDLELDREAAQKVIENGDVVANAIIEAALKSVRAITAPESEFRYDKREDGWELIEDVGFAPVITSIEALELVSFLRDGESYINGEEMTRRASEKLGANLGQKHLEWLLEHQNQIPESWRKFYLVAPGTKWRGPSGSRGVPCLSWGGGGWDLDFFWLGSVYWSDGGRLVRPRK